LNFMRDSSKDPSPRTRRENIVDAVLVVASVGYLIYVLVFA